MKKIINFCIIISFSFIISLLCNCTDSELTKYNREMPHKDFSIEEAKKFFEKQYTKNISVSRALNRNKGERLVTSSDFVPLWEKAIASSKAELACYDIPIMTDIHYKALYTTYHNGKAKAYSVNVYQKLIVVKNQLTGNMGTYILNLIPNTEYDKKYQKQVSHRFINCGDKGDFSGIAFYVIPKLNRILRVNYYEKGVKQKGVFLLGRSEQMEEKMNIAYEILHGVVVKGKKRVTTRGYGEDDWWDNDYYDDSDKDDYLWDMDSGALLNPNDFDLGNGTFEETENGIIYIDQNGNIFEMEDIDGDGWLDTPVSSDVVIEPEENLDWETGNEEWMEATRPGGIDYEDPDNEEDNNNIDDDTSDNFPTDDKKKEEEQPKSLTQIANEMNQNKQLISKVKEIFNGVFMQPNAKENGWIRDIKSVHSPNYQEQGKIKYDWSSIQHNITEWYHSHPGGGPIPSFADLKALGQIYQNGYINIDKFSYGIISDFGCASFIITSEDDFSKFANDLRLNNSRIHSLFNLYVQPGEPGGLETRLSKYSDFLESTKSGIQLIFNYYDPNIEKWEGWKIP